MNHSHGHSHGHSDCTAHDHPHTHTSKRLSGRVFHAGDPLWAKLGKPIGGTATNLYPDRGSLRDVTTALKLIVGLSVIGLIVGVPTWPLAVSLLLIGGFNSICNAHARQTRLANIQGYAGNINASTRLLPELPESAHPHNTRSACSKGACSGKHKNPKSDFTDKRWWCHGISVIQKLDGIRQSVTKKQPKLSSHSKSPDHHHEHEHKCGNDCSKKVLHGLTHAWHDKRWGFLGIFVVRQMTNVASGMRLVASLTVAAASSLGNAFLGIGIVTDAVVAVIDSVRSSYYAYSIYDQEYDRYVKQCSSEKGSRAFDLIKAAIGDDSLTKFTTVTDFLDQIKAAHRFGDHKDFPVTKIVFIMNWFIWLTQDAVNLPAASQEFKTQVKDKIKASNQKFAVKKRSWPFSIMSPHRNDCIVYGGDTISLRSWQASEGLEFRQFMVNQSPLARAEHSKFHNLSDKVADIIDKKKLNTSHLGRHHYQLLHTIIMSVLVSDANLEGIDANAAIAILDTAVDSFIAEIKGITSNALLTPDLVRQHLSQTTLGHPHQELDGYAQKPAILLGALAHNLTDAELYLALKTKWDEYAKVGQAKVEHDKTMIFNQSCDSSEVAEEKASVSVPGILSLPWVR